MADEPGQPAGKWVVFASGNEAEAKHTVKKLFHSSSQLIENQYYILQ
jgi:hypothetical protein